MWLQETPWFIDYQSAYLGTPYYDLASLLFASKSGLDDNARESLLSYFYEIAGIAIGFEEYRSYFFLFVLIRRLRSLGTYGFLATVKGKTGFLNKVGPTLAELQFLLTEKAELKGFHQTLNLVNTLIDRWQAIKKEGI
jgi:aminoglycoside/choline kinase family phosphotransferase